MSFLPDVLKAIQFVKVVRAISISPNSTYLPTLRWGITATGLISSWFVEDLVLPRTDAKAEHILQAVGSSSLEKGKAFVEKNAPDVSPTVYGSYAEVYADPRC